MAILELKGVSKSFSRNGAGEVADRQGSRCCATSICRFAKTNLSASSAGPGSGKTTLISLIAGLIEAGRGRDSCSKAHRSTDRDRTAA